MDEKCTHCPRESVVKVNQEELCLLHMDEALQRAEKMVQTVLGWRAAS